MKAPVDNEHTACSALNYLLAPTEHYLDGVVLGVISAITLHNNLCENWSHKISQKLEGIRARNAPVSSGSVSLSPPPF